MKGGAEKERKRKRGEAIKKRCFGQRTSKQRD